MHSLFFICWPYHGENCCISFNKNYISHLQSSNLFQLEAFSSIPCRWNSIFRLIRWCCLDHCCLDLVWLDSKMATCVFSFDYQENIPTNLMQHFVPVVWNTFFFALLYFIISFLRRPLSFFDVFDETSY